MHAFIIILANCHYTAMLFCCHVAYNHHAQSDPLSMWELMCHAHGVV